MPTMTLSPEILFRLASWLRSRKAVLLLNVTAGAAALSVCMAYAFYMDSLKDLEMPATITLRELGMRQVGADIKYLLMLVSVIFAWLLLDWLRIRFSSYLFGIAGTNGHQESLLARGRDLVKRSGLDLTFIGVREGSGPSSSGGRYSERTAFDLLLIRIANRIVSAFHSRARERMLLENSLGYLHAVDPCGPCAAEASYLDGLIRIRGMEAPDDGTALQRFRAASILGNEFAQFELALLLGATGNPDDRDEAIELLTGFLKSHASPAYTAYANVNLGELLLARRKAGDVQAADDLLKHGIAMPGAEIATGDRDVRTRLQVLYAQIAALREAEAQSKLADSEREKRIAVENVMAMFSHKFRGPVDSVIFSAEHRFKSQTLASVGRTMNGLLNIFSYVSTASEKLRQKLFEDNAGDVRLTNIVQKGLWLALVQLLPRQKLEFLAPHYYAHCRRAGILEKDVTPGEWEGEDEYIEIQKRISEQWEAEIGDGGEIVEGARIYEWLQLHICEVVLTGVDEASLSCRQFGPKESLMLIVVTEIFVNALKHFDTTTNGKLEIEWAEGDAFAEFRCTNPSSRRSRSRANGSGRGHDFLKIIADKIGGEFTPPDTSDRSTASFRIPIELAKGRTQ